MKKTKLLLSTAIAGGLLFLASCGGSSDSTPAVMADLSLADKGIPITISAPEGAEVKKGMLTGEMDGVKIINQTVKKDKFNLDITMFDTDNEKTVEELVASDKEVSGEDDGFEIITEDANGYLYKTVSDGTTDFSFYYCVIKDNRAIEFTTGLSFSEFSQANVETMMGAAKSAK